jgi:uncharacterized protein (DUF58 family)
VKLELSRLNHVLIPATKAGRDRYRNGRISRRLRIFSWFYTRLSQEGRSLVLVGLAGAILALDVGRTEAHVLVLATAALVVSSLSFTRLYRLSGVTIEARAPRRVPVGEELGLTVSVFNDGGAAHRAIRIETPLLPWDGKFTHVPPTIDEIGPGGRVHATVRARFVARGEHHLDPFRAALVLPLGLSQGTPLFTRGVRFVVVPKTARVVSLEKIRKQAHHMGGATHAARGGDATALLGVRQYRPGDPVRDLHARSWARHGVPVVREYQEEQFLRTGILLDTNAKGAPPKHLEAALSLAAGVVAHLSSSEELVDAMVVGTHSVRLSSGKRQASIDQALDLLAGVQSTAKFSAEGMLAGIGPHLSRLSSVVFISLGWDDSRASVPGAIRARGVACVTFVVSERESPAPDRAVVAPDAILGGETLFL